MTYGFRDPPDWPSTTDFGPPLDGIIAPPGSFSWALEQMKARKKVRRASHAEDLYWAIFNDEICTFQRGNGAAWLSGVSITDEDARATDWHLHEEGE